ncbi:MAG: hypothetical protein J1F05_05560 [Muribaculaceae bacterium]|nr:hypothetical protein [Muribaculaceae bacterium]
MKNNKVLGLFLAAIFIFLPLVALSETAPRWIDKGVKELDKGRSNSSYSFHVLHYVEPIIGTGTVGIGKTDLLVAYADSLYNETRGGAVVVDSIPALAEAPTTYILKLGSEATPVTVYAQLVDYYEETEDFPDGLYEYNLYQLYAISQPNVEPQFDEFALTNRYNALPIAMSIIPGAGQIYKGQVAKGIIILGAEVAMLAGTLYGTFEYHHYKKLAKDHSEFYENYISKTNTFKQLRLFCAVAGAGLYAYNLFDAALCNGARYVKITRKNEQPIKLSFVPMVSPETTGVSLCLSF